ncbi:hypothetical protein VP01_112g3 [Puccinia sorghi]|uniref:Small nuclear ribonucleoprotein Prp3 C-terminal domain-containing protein n=1 Tax=Puccinia sorghi TaxID=27349 RepID=A0A0L6VSE7_9BASI|nr:hypothetical protein VP01_112g3 [Puccinia sorghi]
MGREDLERFRGEYGARLSAHDEEGSVCLDVGLATLLELAGQFSITPTGPHNPNPPSSSSSSPIQPFHNPPPDGKVSMAWSVFWMHHIKATGKRKQIVGWARELQIRGCFFQPLLVCRYPGALVIDGPKASVEEYSNRLKALRWKAIQQRHFEVYHIPLLDPAQDQQQQELSERHRRIRLAPTGPLPPVDEVIEVQSMAQLLQHASHSSGLQDLLLQILKIK